MTEHLSPTDFAAQDWIIIVEALVEWASRPTCGTVARSERAWELVTAIAAMLELSPQEVVLQADGEWRGAE